MNCEYSLNGIRITCSVAGSDLYTKDIIAVFILFHPFALLLFALTAKEVSHLTGKITRGLSQINANG
jgi:hypothetical protein